MADTAVEQAPAPRKSGWLPLLAGLLLAVGLGGGGFFAAYSGLILGHPPQVEEAATASPLPDIAFVPVEPIMIPLGPAGQNQHLRIVSEIEVAKPHAAEVTLLLPRIRDVMNSYLRAVEVADLQDPAALVRFRAQILRRVQTVTGEGRVRDLLITEFMLN
ncbi:MAG: flagellar basal body protein FliL [Rhodobacteraceae bacterium GWE1_64_9]|nr:MAG: flagellar basal body protein FliL [Rhodobacteraceae bacterium GWE1_64_9]OHC48817.1 MAG: flagellar basal body protein FliL [Rhodobacteraceae bacterium GWF1_65_7]HBD92397.1 flagellar basal body protein FliL [Gemmobacter sp.]